MKLIPSLAACSALALAACATTTFKVFETRGDGIVQGRGGTKTLQDGMEIWDHGDPPRRFKVLGIIDDERSGGLVPMSQLHADVVKRAREVGGDALIQIRSQAQMVGYQTSGNATTVAYGSSTTATAHTTSASIRRNSAQFAVIRYVD